MKAAIIAAAVLIPSSLFAQDRAAGIVYNSAVVTNRAWRRDVVMRHEPTGEIFNDSGKVGDAAASVAAGQAADGAAEISDAANAAMVEALQTLDAAREDAATNAVALALVLVPETSRTNLTAYVVKTETDGVTDTQWVWFNRKIDLEPNRYVVYQTHDRAATNKVTWANWTNAVSVTQNWRTWQGCHVCTVTRPTWAQGAPCLDLPNDRLGGADGFDFGDLLLTMGGQPLYTGLVTNGVTGAVLYFDNGFCKGSPKTE